MAKQVKNDKDKESSGGKKALFFVLALIVIGAATFGGVYFFMQTKGTAEKEVVKTTFVLSKETKINLSDKKASYVMTGISISYDSSNKKLATEIEEKKIELQDKAIWYLKSKVTTDFEAGKEVELKKGLIESLNKELHYGKILDVYYSTGEDTASFLVQ
jgi:flagellar FliL protein